MVDITISKPVLQDCGRPVTNAELDELESQLGFRLPLAYRAFLMRYNGGLFRPDVSAEMSSRDGKQLVNIQGMHGVALYPWESGDLLDTYSLVKDRLEELPIAGDLERTPPVVFFWDHEGNDGDGERESFSDTDLDAFLSSFCFHPLDQFTETEPPFKAVEVGDVKAMEQLISHKNVHVKNKDGRSLIQVAASSHQPEAVRFLLALHADPNSGPASSRPLEVAVHGGNAGICRLLVESGASLEAKDSRGYTPLFVAVELCHLRAAAELIRLGADISVTTDEGWTLKDFADTNGKWPVVQAMIREFR